LGHSDLSRAFRYLLPYRWGLAFVLVVSLAGTGLSLYLPLLSRGLVDDALLGQDMQALLRIVLLFAAIPVVSFILNVAASLIYTKLSAEVLFDMRVDVYQHLQSLSPRFYAIRPLGDIVSRLNSDVGEIQRIVAETALAWVTSTAFLVGTVAMLVYLDWRTFLVSIVVLPPSLWVLVRYRRKLEGSVRRVRELSADVGSFLIETIQGMKLVVGSNAQRREVGRFRTLNDDFVRALMSMRWLGFLAGGLPALILVVGTSAVFFYGGSRVIAGTITLGTFVAFMAYQMRVLIPIRGLMNLYASLATARVSLRRVNELLDTPPAVVDPAAPVRLGAVRGEVELVDVTLSFGRGGDVLAGVSLTIGSGETVALVGPTGSGKSTISDLLTRHVDPDRGRVLLDGHDLREIALSDLRRLVMAVDQNTFLFSASLLANIRFAKPEAPVHEVEKAILASGLHDFVGSLPDGLETLVGERGAALSAGQRQQVAIARALLADPVVLILDEATANLDLATQEDVVQGYERVMKGRTTIVISHRPELARRADRVVVLADGRIEDTGSPGAPVGSEGDLAQLLDPQRVRPIPGRSARRNTIG
jgi:ATP-binding cassette subfamily B protein